MKHQIGVGLIGYGMAGRVFHAPVITSLPALRLKTVVERRGIASRERYPWVEVVTDAEALWADEEIALVVVATPNSSHFELARQALSAGKHVVVEKPFTDTSEQAQQLIDLAFERKRLISVHQNRRWDGDFLTVRQLLSAQHLGRLVAYESRFDRFRNYRRPNAWREQEGVGNGILYDLGSHLIDQALVLFGLPQSVTADVRIQREWARAADDFELTLHYENLKVTLGAGMLAREPGARFSLHGTEGSFVKYGTDPQEDALKHGRTPAEPDWGTEPEAMWGKLNTGLGGLHFTGRLETLPGSYQSYYQNIAGVIAGREELAVKPAEAKNTIRIIELALQSNEQKRTVSFD
ncbi:MAG TPA: oxidoreductase [Pyrinomonadaceae bacterium]